MSDAVTGKVRMVLRLEGVAVLAVSALFYARHGEGWGVFFLFFLLPDLSFIGYLAGPRIGALAYNVAHSYLGPLVCLGCWAGWPSALPLAVGLIWAAHIGFDRALGYGLKYGQGFGYTHLGLIGQAARAPSPSRGSALNP